LSFKPLNQKEPLMALLARRSLALIAAACLLALVLLGVAASSLA
jgi:hypothetical protein